jgi:hypothetical protein
MQMSKTIDELLEEFGDAPYSREQHAEDFARVLARLREKHDVTTQSEVDEIVREHRYAHTAEDPEDEYIQLMAIARVTGWS